MIASKLPRKYEFLEVLEESFFEKVVKCGNIDQILAVKISKFFDKYSSEKVINFVDFDYHIFKNIIVKGEPSA